MRRRDFLRYTGAGVVAGGATLGLGRRGVRADDTAWGDGVTSLDAPIAGHDKSALGAALTAHCGALMASRQFNLVWVAPPNQRSSPRIVVGGQTYLERCQALAPLVFDASAWTVTCHDGSIDVAKAGAAAH